MAVIKDDVRLASILFVVIGVGYLFPFSALTQPVDYWHKIFPDFNIEFPLTVCYLWINLLVLGIIVFLGGEPSYTFRIVGGFIGQFLVLVFVPSLYFFHLSESTNYILIMLATSFAAVATSYIDSVAISFAAQYPRKIQEALQFGIGLSTLIGSVYRLITKAVFPPEQVVESSLLYFYCGAVTILTGVGAYYWLLKLPLSAECLRFGFGGKFKGVYSGVSTAEDDVCFHDSPEVPKSAELVQAARSVLHSALESNVKGFAPNAETSLLAVASKHIDGPVSNYGGLESGLESGLDDIQTSSGKAVTSNKSETSVDKWDVFRRTFYGEFLVFLVYFTSLCLWPALITEIRSFNFPGLQESQWWPLLMLFLFSVTDCAGRLLTPYRFGLTRHTVHYVVYSRMVLAPLLICSAKALLFTHDFFTVLFVALLGLSNGYGGSLAIILLNETVEEHEKGVVGMFTGFFLNLGLVFGATASMGLERWLIK